jgi:hypothetical protein
MLTISLFCLTACGGDAQVSVYIYEPTEGGVSEVEQDNSAVSEGLDSCPDPIIIQTDWFPESEYGATYELFGDGTYYIDNGNRSVAGTLHDGEVDTGIGLEVRTGGPAIGFTPVASHMYTDGSITLGYANTEGQITRFDSAPLLSVVAPLEKNPQMIMWDPDTYPDVESIADLGERDITISVFGAEVFSEVFIAQGIWSADQVDPSYDGSPANFIANQGSIAQQGFASAEPYNYKNTYEQWGKDVKYQLLHDAGFPVYSQTLAIRPEDKDFLDACLTDLVPIIQRAVVNFSSNPRNTNALIVDVVKSFNSFWVYNKWIADYSVQTQWELGLIGNGNNDIVGDMDQNRIRGVIDLMSEAGIDTNEISPSDIFTNEYIDESIGFD